MRIFGFRRKQTFTQNIPNGKDIEQKKLSHYPEEWTNELLVEQNGILMRIEQHLGRFVYLYEQSHFPPEPK